MNWRHFLNMFSYWTIRSDEIKSQLLSRRQVEKETRYVYASIIFVSTLSVFGRGFSSFITSGVMLGVCLRFFLTYNQTRARRSGFLGLLQHHR